MPDLKGPLRGIRVLDLGRHQAGPRCAQVLARLGAEVIKIERLGGEETRYHAPWVRKQSAYWVQYNSGKKSVSMDLRKEAGKEVLRKLVKISDVVLQNCRPGTIEKMGFGYDVLKELNPRIIMVNVSAYGQFGPYREQIGYDPVGQTMAGVAMVTSIVSVLTRIPVRANVAMTGEITLRGRVLPVGGLKEKLLAARRAGLKTVLIPKENEKDLADIPDNVKRGIKIVPVATVDDVLRRALVRQPEPVEWAEVEPEQVRPAGTEATTPVLPN